MDISFNKYKNRKLSSLDEILQKKPTFCQKISYYWIALTNNQKHKLDYIIFKSRLHRTETIIDYYTRSIQKYKELSEPQPPQNDQNLITCDIIGRMEWIICEYSEILWSPKVPYENFLHKYFCIRNDILNIEPMSQNNYILYSTNYEPKSLNKIKHTVYIAQELIILTEFIKNDIDKNDELLFKLLILFMNGLIFISQLIWESIY
jgi:hypothetical protein